MESSSGSVVMAPRGRENKFFDPPYHLREATHAKKARGEREIGLLLQL